jgi:uncharacterized phage protein (TIGR01671 family)
MNREIEFRGKRIDNGEWVYGSLITNVISLTGEVRINGHISIDHETKFTAIVDENGCIYEVDPNTVGQYTGLKDKNGKKIFEGDIVNDYIGNTYVLKDFDELIDFYYFYGEYALHQEGIEIIGNIYSNPELLEK